jgi:hypothetical protein
MTRDEAIDTARDAARRATTLAGHAESAAHHADRKSKVPLFAAAGAVWADTARAWAAIAAALPEPATDDETPEV